MVPVARFRLAIIYKVRSLTYVLNFMSKYHYRPKLESFVKKTSHAPVLGLLSAFINDWMPLIDEYYYCKHGYFLLSTSECD